ncbi:flavodoxin [Halioglobus maricola]|uniref:Flavodoxin n=1 Tax=Halioglobus maricola TaxID=2601894 RepID=A0A5P9NPY6_9GAMM|nr:flavodoxin [Halioglobus maricola]
MCVVYHSQSGSCARLARAAAAAAAEVEGVEVTVLRACDASTSAVVDTSGLLLVAAENSGSMSGESKAFLDRLFYPAIGRALVIPYALLVSAGNDGRGAVRQAQRILSGVPFTAACEPVIARGDVTDEHLTQARELGQGFAAGLEMGIF